MTSRPGAPDRPGWESRGPTRSRGPFAHLTVRDNVAVAAMFGQLGRDRRTAEREAGPLAGVHGPRRPRGRCFPSALNLHQRKFLELARALASEPRLVMLDGVLSGLTPTEMADADPAGRGTSETGGTTVVFVEHIIRAVMDARRPRRSAGCRPDHRERALPTDVDAASRRRASATSGRPMLEAGGASRWPTGTPRRSGTCRSRSGGGRAGGGRRTERERGRLRSSMPSRASCRSAGGGFTSPGEGPDAAPRLIRSSSRGIADRPRGSPACHRDDGRGEPRDRLLCAGRAAPPAKTRLERVYGIFPVLRAQPPSERRGRSREASSRWPRSAAR